MTTTKTLKQLAKSVKLTSEYGAHLDYDKQSDWQQQANGYHCTLRYKGRQYSFDFWMGSGLTGEPDTEGCLDCLLSDSMSADQSFEEWCNEYGHDTDSRKAEAIWKACQKVRENMQRLLSEDFEAFLYAERD